MTRAVGYRCPSCGEYHHELELQEVGETEWRRSRCRRCGFIEYYPPEDHREVLT